MRPGHMNTMISLYHLMDPLEAIYNVAMKKVPLNVSRCATFQMLFCCVAD